MQIDTTHRARFTFTEMEDLLRAPAITRLIETGVISEDQRPVFEKARMLIRNDTSQTVVATFDLPWPAITVTPNNGL